MAEGSNHLIAVVHLSHPSTHALHRRGNVSPDNEPNAATTAISHCRVPCTIGKEGEEEERGGKLLCVPREGHHLGAPYAGQAWSAR